MRFVLLSLLLASVFARPKKPVVIPPMYPNDPLTLEGRDVKVLIAGGGLAGMSAALVRLFIHLGEC